MRRTTLIMIVLSTAAVILYWTPLSIKIGKQTYLFGGYPWNVPEEMPGNENYDPNVTRQAFILIGVALTAVFGSISAIALYLSQQIEETVERVEKEKVRTFSFLKKEEDEERKKEESEEEDYGF